MCFGIDHVLSTDHTERQLPGLSFSWALEHWNQWETLVNWHRLLWLRSLTDTTRLTRTCQGWR